jgi:hypothetical protein
VGRVASEEDAHLGAGETACYGNAGAISRTDKNLVDFDLIRAMDTAEEGIDGFF